MLEGGVNIREEGVDLEKRGRHVSVDVLPGCIHVLED